jgi:hypothetical protein
MEDCPMVRSNASLAAKIVRVKFDQGASGAYFATSPDLKGLLVSKMTMNAVQAEIPRAITELYAVCGLSVVVTPVEQNDDDDFEDTWVAVPAAVASIALADA